MKPLNLDRFVESTFRNAWIQEKNIRIYVRRSQRFIDDKAIPCLDIGSVEVDENKWGQGIFTKFLNRFEAEAKKLKRAVFIESVINERLLAHLKNKRGYRIKSENEPTSVYKLSS